MKDFFYGVFGMNAPRLMGFARVLDDEISTILYKIQRHLPKEGLEPCTDTIVQARDVFFNSIINVSSEIGSIFSKITDAKKGQLSEADLWSIEKSLKEVCTEFLRLFVAFAHPLISFQSLLVSAKEADEKRFFKKIKGNALENINTQIDLIINIENVWRTNVQVVTMYQETLPSVIDLLVTDARAYEEERVNTKAVAITEAKIDAQTRGMMELYKGQLGLLAEHKKNGLDVERETFEMRKKLIELEREENSAMIKDLINTLDSI